MGGEGALAPIGQRRDKLCPLGNPAGTTRPRVARGQSEPHSAPAPPFFGGGATGARRGEIAGRRLATATATATTTPAPPPPPPSPPPSPPPPPLSRASVSGPLPAAPTLSDRHRPTACYGPTAMLLLHLPLTATASAAGYVYPLYASYKAITAPTRPASTAGQYTWRIPRAASSGPASARDDAAPVSGAAARTEMAEIETWLMYWSVLAVVQTLETFFGWSWSWYVSPSGDPFPFPFSFSFSFPFPFLFPFAQPRPRGCSARLLPRTRCLISFSVRDFLRTVYSGFLCTTRANSFLRSGWFYHRLGYVPPPPPSSSQCLRLVLRVRPVYPATLFLTICLCLTRIFFFFFDHGLGITMTRVHRSFTPTT